MFKHPKHRATYGFGCFREVSPVGEETYAFGRNEL